MIAFQTIVLKNVDDIQNNGNGTWSVRFKTETIDNKDSQIIDRLFPNLSSKAWELLGKELLLQSIATEAEAEAEPPKKKEKPVVMPVEWPKSE